MHAPTMLAAIASLSLLLQLPAQIHVSPTGNDATGDGSSAAPYKTITKAASVASPDATLLLAAGTFGDDEQIVLGSKNLTLVGAGMGVTIVKPNATLTNTLPAGAPPGTPTEHRVAILVDGPARVDVRDLTIDGDFRMPSSSRLHGLLYRNGADGTIGNVEVKNVRTNPLNGAQGPIAVLVRGDDVGNPCEVSLHRVWAHDWGKNGLVAAYNAVLWIEECVWQGSGQVGSGLPAQNGVQISYGAVATIRNNVLADSWYTGPTWTATGMLLYDAGPGCIVESNHVTRCQAGIYAFQSTPTAAALALRRNRVTEAQYGLSIFGTTGVSVHDNVLHGAGPNNAFDDSATNVWDGNNYSDWSGTGSYPIQGGSAVDQNPRRGCDEFLAPVGIPLGGVPIDLVVADFGGSAAADFATVNQPASLATPPSLTVGIAVGAFPAYATTTLPFGAAGETPAALVHGEFDGNAGRDLAVVTADTRNVYVFANDGSGGFTPLGTPVQLSANALVPNDLAAGDLNGDGRADLVVATLGSLVAPGGGFVLLNNGTGTGFTESALPASPAFAEQCKGVALGDLDGDNRADVAITEGNGTNGSLHLFQGDGLGGFTVLTAPLTVDADPTSVAIFDWDADGKNDLGVTSTKAAVPLLPGSCTLFVNALPAGFTRQVHAVGVAPQSLVAGDVADDADPDTLRRDAALVDFVSGRLTLLRTFGRAGFEMNLECLAGTAPRAAALAEMNGDSFADLVVADAAASTLHVLRGRATAQGDLYGQGCAGTAGRLPLIATSGAPGAMTQPNLSFGVQLRDARPLSVAVLVASATASAPPYVPCSLMIGSVDVVWTAFTDGSGHANVQVPVPAMPDFSGVFFHLQWAVVDPAGGLVGALSLTQGLKVRVGR